ncbi:uncharacterized protein LOC117587641 [Drosophila guanche]|uniref:Tetratricopeptide repeat protein n=1 Tax=Drosophila guanche TaxID=7266 RepID=A0A3B0KIB0_DROGU|nr:uncharacterized protein LOC117587641 [Drosophila guanche]SPP85496.1 Hypothetical predicted protein [Drosophila guanche]
MAQRHKEMMRLSRQIKSKFPHRAFRDVTFDREQIRKSITSLSYEEARRVKGPVYEALEEELRCAGCHMLPEFLRCLAGKEQSLYDSLNIRERITDDRPLLYAVIENLKQAELAVRRHKLKGLKECFSLFYQTMVLLEPHREKYSYALTSVLEHIVGLCRNIEGQERDAAEMVARIYYTYAMYLVRLGQRSDAISYFQIAMNLVRGHVWTAQPDMRAGSQTLHELVAQDLARQLLIHGKQIVRQQPQEAIDIARRATVLIAEIGREKNLDIFCDTFLERAYFLMESGNYNAAQQCLEQIRPQIIACTDYKFVKLNIKYYLFHGQCAEILANPDKAISSYKKALRLSRLYSHKDTEAEILLHLGKIFAKDTQKTSIAKKCYEQAKRIYVDFNDDHSLKTTNYLLAKLMADEITPLYMAMLKSSTTRYCAFFNLRQWKNRCRPFWKKLGNEIIKQEIDDIYCLLDEERDDPASEGCYTDMDRQVFKLEEGDL